jgi:hypothetical protein
MMKIRIYDPKRVQKQFKQPSSAESREALLTSM